MPAYHNPIGIAGAGRLAQALGRLLRERGEPVAFLASRNLQHARDAAQFIGAVETVTYAELPACASRILIAVSDDAVTPDAKLLVDSAMRTGSVLHTSGALSVDALAPLADQGVSCAALHPLQTVPSPEEGVASLPGVTFALDGEGTAAAWAGQIVSLLDGKILRIPPEVRPAYHAAAVMAGNGAIALLDAAVILMGSAGVDEATALGALAPLVRKSVENSLTIGPAGALTGPASRGDAGTLLAHWRSVSETPIPVRELYRALSLQLVDLAKRRGLPEETARGIEELFGNSHV